MDYFPLSAGLFWVYESQGERGRRTVRVELASVEEAGGVTRAAGRSRVGEGPWLEFSVVRDAAAVRIEGVVELPLPPSVGAAWDAGGDALRVESERARVETPAGRFEDCLRVSVRLAGGDAGVGERVYAPDVGLVKESLSSEGEPSEKLLVSWGRSEA